ncbi:MAG: amidohydrolase family protein [Treponema sp.]|nr:amidohydrolase family protein [Treponema sp.]
MPDLATGSYTLENAHITSSAKKIYTGSLSVHNKRICYYHHGGPHINLGDDFIVYPALINSHDHLRGNYLPRVGPSPGSFYLNWLPWDNDLKASDVYAERSNLSIETMYMLGSFKNLFSGVTTVQDHFPHAQNRNILPELPIRAFLGYGLAHESSSYDLKWGDGIELEHKRAVQNDWPFITHLAEGFDEESMNGVQTLMDMGILDDYCVLVHCIALSSVDIDLLAQAKSHVVWCPASNMFMFNVTCKVRQLLKAGVNLSLGTDSTHTGSFNLFEEMHTARAVYRSLYGEDLPAKTLFDMVTLNPAKAFHIEDRLGSLDSGHFADILILKAKTDDVFENIVHASAEDIEFLSMKGKALYGTLRFIDVLGGSLPDGYSIINVGGTPHFIIGDPVTMYRAIRTTVGYNKILDFLPFEPEEQ